MTVYVENPKKKIYQNTTRTRSEFSKIGEYKINIQNQSYVYLLSMNN